MYVSVCVCVVRRSDTYDHKIRINFRFEYLIVLRLTTLIHFIYKCYLYSNFLAKVLQRHEDRVDRLHIDKAAKKQTSSRKNTFGFVYSSCLHKYIVVVANICQ